jgi:hypothetical protein
MAVIKSYYDIIYLLGVDTHITKNMRKQFSGFIVDVGTVLAKIDLFIYGLV